MKGKFARAIEFIGGEKMFYIIAGIVFGLFLIAGIISTIAGTPTRTNTTDTTSSVETSETT